MPFGTVAIAIPFYLARPDLVDLHAERTGHVEGLGRRDLLRYLRHEMGHVVNYAYRLYEREDWVELFGPMTRPYREEYRPEPFSRRYVRHLPGWYAQKHPDEDWAETFAVWLTPGRDWRAEYSGWPEALGEARLLRRLDEGAVPGRSPGHRARSWTSPSPRSPTPWISSTAPGRRMAASFPRDWTALCAPSSRTGDIPRT